MKKKKAKLQKWDGLKEILYFSTSGDMKSHKKLEFGPDRPEAR